ncbi:MAG TPA: VOC family protein [Bryobacteraceae bacterium]|nr:VOC family protein [Bryobacteraceae bacterium]
MAAGASTLIVDHVTLAGADLRCLCDEFTATTGIAVEYGGPHANHATEMALASFFDGSYIELIGIRPQADAEAVDVHPWAPFLQADAGPCAFALGVPDLRTEMQRLRRAGIPVGEATKSGRTRPDGVALRWETAAIGAGPLGAFFPFLIQDLTPRHQRVYPSGDAATKEYDGVSLVVIAVRDLAQATALYRQAFDLPQPLRERDLSFGAELAWFESAPVALATPLEADSWLAQRLARFGESPCAILLAPHNDIQQHTDLQWFGKRLTWFSEGPFHWRIGAWSVAR